MPRSARIDKENYYYHTICRGQRKNPIFFSENDFSEFYKIVNYSLLKTDIEINAFCLMRNHIHLLVYRKKNPLHKFFHTLMTTYAKYFNKKYELSGHVFQGRYKSFIVLGNKYLFTALDYIHNNPVKIKIVNTADKYLHSSASLYLNESDNFKIPIKKVSFKTEIIFDTNKIYNIQQEYIGEKSEYISLQKRKEGRGKGKVKERRKSKKSEFYKILNGIMMEYNIDSEDIKNLKWNRSKAKIRKEIFTKLIRFGFSQTEIAKYLGYSIQQISNIMRNENL